MRDGDDSGTDFGAIQSDFEAEQQKFEEEKAKKEALQAQLKQQNDTTGPLLDKRDALLQEARTKEVASPEVETQLETSINDLETQMSEIQVRLNEQAAILETGQRELQNLTAFLEGLRAQGKEISPKLLEAEEQMPDKIAAMQNELTVVANEAKAVSDPMDALKEKIEAIRGDRERMKGINTEIAEIEQTHGIVEKDGEAIEGLPIMERLIEEAEAENEVRDKFLNEIRRGMDSRLTPEKKELNLELAQQFLGKTFELEGAYDIKDIEQRKEKMREIADTVITGFNEYRADQIPDGVRAWGQNDTTIEQGNRTRLILRNRARGFGLKAILGISDMAPINMAPLMLEAAGQNDPRSFFLTDQDREKVARGENIPPQLMEIHDRTKKEFEAFMPIINKALASAYAEGRYKSLLSPSGNFIKQLSDWGYLTFEGPAIPREMMRSPEHAGKKQEILDKWNKDVEKFSSIIEAKVEGQKAKISAELDEQEVTLDRLRENVTALEQEMTKIEMAIGEFEAQISQIDNVDIPELTKESLAQIERKNEKGRQKTNIFNRGSTQQEINNLTASIEGIQDQIAKKNQESESIRISKAEKEKEKTDSETKLTSAKAELAKAEQQLKELEATLKRLTPEK